jgi:Arc/MetJ-type ribon-helix-helix transcriptional regulator
MTTQITTRIPDELGEVLDAAVASGRFASRSEAVVAALSRLAAELLEEKAALRYAAAYRDTPLTGDERRFLEATSARALDALE